MLFGSTLLEVAIGVVFVYLLVSVLCSALNELIEAWLKYRARYLEQGIRKLLSDPGLAESFLNHPLVKPLGENPSYIPARTFSLALWNIATTGAAKAENAAPGVTQNLSEIRTLIGSLDEQQFGNIKTSLLTLIDEAGNDINKARANIEGWYDDAMDRVSGWYKRRTHVILIIIGLAASFALNIDTIQITKALLYHDSLRKSVVDAADNYVKENPAPTPTPATTDTPEDPNVVAEREAGIAKTKINAVRNELDQLGLPIGWPVMPKLSDDRYQGIKDKTAQQTQFTADLRAYNTDPRWPAQGEYGSGILLKLLGLVLTGLAVSQGAPFWFDILNKFMVIRSTVKPREKSHDEGTKDKSTQGDGEDEAEGGK
jgi:hypothetical protein